jgi:mycothiol synthase
MRRPNLLALPSIPPVPEGFVLRLATHNDLASLAKLMSTAFGDPSWTTDRVARELLDDPHCKATWVIVQGDQTVATATALLEPDQQPGTGIVHWVASDPAHRGKKLGFIVCLAVLHSFTQLQCKDSTLLTDDDRLPAIKTYYNLGFEPDHRHESHERRWQNINQKLGI